MDFHHCQQEANKTDQVPGPEEQNIVVPLLGLAGEAGSLLTEYKKHFRDDDAYRIFTERIAEELGDILWYMANIATEAGLSLEEVAQGNLRKIHDRWQTSENGEGSQDLARSCSMNHFHHTSSFHGISKSISNRSPNGKPSK
jgi:NTP pyrophosphatase (non-canonical NTP hydrolase)